MRLHDGPLLMEMIPGSLEESSTFRTAMRPGEAGLASRRGNTFN